MSDAKLAAVKVRVFFGDIDNPEILEVQTLNPDVMNWERTSRKNKWGGIDGNEITFTTFLAWSALRRNGMIPNDMTWEAWNPRVLSVESMRDDEADEPGTPTEPGHVPG
jgi:hypothetical protein